MDVDFTKIANSFKLWQFSLFLSFCLLSLGFTGDIPFYGTSDDLQPGQENLAIAMGAIFFLVTILLKYRPPPE